MKLQRRPYEIIIPTNTNPSPDKYEMMVAKILAQKFQSDIRFIESSTGYHSPQLAARELTLHT